jgi:hypothetical protein
MNGGGIIVLGRLEPHDAARVTHTKGPVIATVTAPHLTEPAQSPTTRLHHQRRRNQQETP